jgi:hypothetical protein
MKWRDTVNAGMSDAILAFLTTQPMTGAGTMSTINVLVRGVHQMQPIEKPTDKDWLVIEPQQPLQTGNKQNPVSSAKKESIKDQIRENNACKKVESSSLSQAVALREEGSEFFPYSAEYQKWDNVASKGMRPVLVFWDIEEKKIEEFSRVLRDFLNVYHPENLMFSGPLESTLPGVERWGAELLRVTFLPADSNDY